MSLRRQLLLVSLLLLSLPWAGCQFIREMEHALRQGQEQSLQATAQAIAAVLAEQEQLLYPVQRREDAAADPGPSLYAHPGGQGLIIDGYGDGWDEIPGVRFASAGDAAPLAVTYRAQTRGDFLYLLLQVEDPQVIYHNPGLSPEPNGDRLVLRTWQRDRRQDYVIATAAPGSVRARNAGPRQRELDAGRIRGFWQDAADGYTLELEIPLAYTGGRLGFYLVNVSSSARARRETLGNITAQDIAAPPWLIYSPERLQAALSPFTGQGRHIQVVDRDRWLIADLPPSGRRDPGDETFWLLRLIYRSILSRQPLTEPPAPPAVGKVDGSELESALAGSGATRLYRDPLRATRTTLSGAAPILHDGRVIGAVLLRQSGEEYLTLTDRAFSRLLGYSLLALGAGALGLLGYASLLSWRIGKLNRAAREAITADSVAAGVFPRSDAQDEIGELSRGYADLLDRLREYNDYLRTLSRKLSHELRTPIAVIQTSLENLEQARARDESATVYLDRAREGLVRLNSILTAMSEANRLEESIRNNTARELDLVPLLREVFAAYRDVYPGHELALELQPEAAWVLGVPELVVQALDKLMDNAASFCPPGQRIELALRPGAGGWDISVSNAGPLLPADMHSRLFEPMVSLRDGVSQEVHLGLGLHVVKLISDFHQGRISTANLDDQSGVRFTLTLPGLPSA